MSYNEQPGEDPRALRTRQAIQDAFIRLTVSKGFAAVTVREITNEAKVNRATFYLHYRDKSDLVDQYAQEVYDLIFSGAADAEAARDTGLVKVFEHIGANAPFFRVMLGENGDPAFAEKLRYCVQKRLRRFLPEARTRDKVSTDLYLGFLSSGAVGVLRWWLENGMPYSPTELAALAHQINVVNFSAVFAAR